MNAEADLLIADRVLLYDADCGFCQRWCNWARRRGAESAVRFEPCQPSVDLRNRAGISETDCGRAAFLVECDASGKVVRTRRAAGAINGVMARLPGGRNLFYRVLSVVYAVPGLKQLEDLGYRVIANNRKLFGGGDSSCEIDSRS